MLARGAMHRFSSIPGVLLAARFGLLLTASLLLAPGCSPSEEASDCKADGDCAPGEQCLAGACRAECVSIEDCAPGGTCTAWRFSSGREVALCSTQKGRYATCGEDAECDSSAGFSCVQGLCRIPCRSHGDCGSVGHCARLEAGTYCEPGTPTLRGRMGARCPLGESECDADAGFTCLGSGPGDLDAFCSTDCTSDDACPIGYRCGSRRVAPCGSACGVAGDPARPGCAPLDEIGPGLRYQCGVHAVIRRLCEPSSFCSPCEKDEDCLSVPGQICARDEAGERICTVPCDSGAGSCPWGNATSCGNYDEERGLATCSHRSGACRGNGNGCSPCIDDRDCPGGFCSVFSFSGERFCIDLRERCDCGTSASPGESCIGHGCPLTPGGLEMTCRKSRFDDDLLGERCVGASSSTGGILGASEQSGCWPP